MGQLLCDWTPTPRPRQHNNSQAAWVCRLRAEHTATSRSLAAASNRQEETKKQALELGEEKPTRITTLPLILRLWPINISCRTSNFFFSVYKHWQETPPEVPIRECGDWLGTLSPDQDGLVHFCSTTERERDPCCTCNKTFNIKLKPDLYCFVCELQRAALFFIFWRLRIDWHKLYNYILR